MSAPAATWQRNAWVMTITVFVVFMGFAFVLPFLPLFVRDLGVKSDREAALWAGILIAVSPLLAGLLAPVWGRLGDRRGHKVMAIRALASYVVLLALSAAVRNVWELLACRVGIGLFGGVGPLGLAMATAGAPREQTGKAVGMIQAAQILSAAAGPFLGGFLADTIGTRATFVVTAGLCATALALVVWGYQEAPAAAAAAQDRSMGFTAVLRLPRVAALLLVLFVVNFIGRSFTPILPLYIEGLGVPHASLASATGMLISLYSVAAALSASVLGKATRRLPPRPLLVASLAGGAVTVLPMAAIGSFGAMLLLGVLLGLASGGALTLCYTIGGLLVPGDRKATAFGFFSGAALFGGALSPILAGYAARWTVRGIFYVDAALFVVLALALLPGALGGAPAAEQSAPAVSQKAEV